MVEDDADLRELLVDHLSGQGYLVMAAGDAETALQLAVAAPPLRMLITDLNLPGLDGAALAAELRACQPSLPVLCISGAVRTLPPELAAVPVLAKPFSLVRLNRLVLDGCGSPDHDAVVVDRPLIEN